MNKYTVAGILCLLIVVVVGLTLFGEGGKTKGDVYIKSVSKGTVTNSGKVWEGNNFRTELSELSDSSATLTVNYTGSGLWDEGATFGISFEAEYVKAKQSGQVQVTPLRAGIANREFRFNFEARGKGKVILEFHK